jgi:hypothetical protein
VVDAVAPTTVVVGAVAVGSTVVDEDESDTLVVDNVELVESEAGAVVVSGTPGTTRRVVVVMCGRAVTGGGAVVADGVAGPFPADGTGAGRTRM